CQTGCSGAAWLPCEALTSKFHLAVTAQPDQSRYQSERIGPYKIGVHPKTAITHRICRRPAVAWTAVEYLYRLFDDGEVLLYVGISNDWTRRLREHWHYQPWRDEVARVVRVCYPDRRSVLAAERETIRSEAPLYNIQHNLGTPELVPPGELLTPEELLAIAIIVIAGGYVLYQLSVAAVEKYRRWQADRQEFRQWQLNRDQASPGPAPPADDDSPPAPPMLAPMSAEPLADSRLTAPQPEEPGPEAVRDVAVPGWLAAVIVAVAVLGMRPMPLPAQPGALSALIC
ncbi:MAG TPA: hypothetical protein VLW50_18935, partial [Streptosporangiaceae bacterium]|nr:hypothetical protein [Streptosporangiaceae bacterium]